RSRPRRTRSASGVGARAGPRLRSAPWSTRSSMHWPIWVSSTWRCRQLLSGSGGRLLRRGGAGGAPCPRRLTTRGLAGEQLLKPTGQLVDQYRLRQNVIDSGVGKVLVAQQDVPRGEHQNRDGWLGRLALRRDLKPVEARHGEIGHDNVHGLAPELGQGTGSAARGDHREVVREDLLQHGQEPGIVIGDQDGRFHTACCCSHRSTQASKSPTRNGLARNVAPVASAKRRTCSVRPDISTNRDTSSGRRSATRRYSLRPSMPGRTTSHRMASYVVVESFSQASVPVPATCTSCPSAVRISFTSADNLSLSSATK